MRISSPGPRQRRQKQRGSALLLAIFFLMLLYLIAIALFRVLPAELHSVGRSRQDMQAHYAATAGVRHAAAWLQLAIAKDPAVGIASPVTNPSFEPFEMPDGPNRAYHPGPGKYNAAGGALAAKFGEFGTDFDGIPFASKPYLEIEPADGMAIDINGDGNTDWFVKVWIFPDRQTYPIPTKTSLNPNIPAPPAVGTESEQQLRFYTIVAEASPFTPDTPRMRVKVTVGQQTLADHGRFFPEWPGDETPDNLTDDVRYYAQNGVPAVDGKFYTGSFFRIEPQSGYFSNANPPPNDANGRPITSFKQLYFGQNSPGSTTPGWDSANWNDGVGYWGGNLGSFNSQNLPWSNSGDKPYAYERLAGNRSNVQYKGAVPLPQNSIDLQKAAWGFGNPNPVAGVEGGTSGVFVKNSNGVIDSAGVYMRGDMKDMALGVATNNILNSTSTNAVGNPALQVTLTQQITAPLATPVVSVTNASQTTAITLTLGTVTQTIRTTITTGTNTVISTQTTYPPITSVQTTVTPRTVFTPITSVGSVSCGTIAGSGMGQGSVLYCPVTVTTGTQTNVTNQTIRTTITTGTNTVVSTQTNRNYVTSVQTTFQPSVQTSVSNSVAVTPVTNTISVSNPYNPVDRVVEVNAVPLTVGSVATVNGTVRTLYNGKTLVDSNGTPVNAPQVLSTGKVAVIKESRAFGDQVVLQTLTGNLNGMVYSEDNIDNLHGVNKGRRTIASDIGTAGTDSGTRITIGNSVNGQRADLLQWGLIPGNPSPNGNNVLGIVAQRVGLNIRGNDVNNLYRLQNNPLRVYAVILAGRGGDEDLTSSNEYTAAAQSRKGGFRVFNLGSNYNGVNAIGNGQAGWFALKGSLIERRGAKTWQPQNNQLTGWNTTFSYDDQAGQNPPPFFPTTNLLDSILVQEQMLGNTGGFTVDNELGTHY